MPDNTKKEICTSCKDGKMHLCTVHYSYIDKNKEEEMLWCDRQGDSKGKECKCVCHQTGYNLPKDFSSPQPTLSDDFEQRFDERFPLHEISESNNLWGDYTLFELHDAIIDFIKKEVRQQRIQAQRELTEEILKIWEVEGINPDFHRKMKSQVVTHWPMLYRFIEKCRGLLSNNKE